MIEHFPSKCERPWVQSPVLKKKKKETEYQGGYSYIITALLLPIPQNFAT
jgi:hypothetical protein